MRSHLAGTGEAACEVFRRPAVRIDERFRSFQEDAANGRYASPLQVPTEIWKNPSWELLERHELEELLLPFLTFTLRRAIRVVPVYKDVYKGMPTMSAFEDFSAIPILVKDSTNAGVGFRDRILANPYLLQPSDIKANYQVYKSGGTKGAATPTFITPLDREIESTALARLLAYAGFAEGDRILSAYNPTHKGGEELKEAILKIGATYIPRRSTDSARDIIETIEQYGVNGLIASQGPAREESRVAKGSGVDFLSLVEAGHDALQKHIEHIAFAGYELSDELISWCEFVDIPVANFLGSSEAIPLGASVSSRGTKTCGLNALHLFHGPHYVEVVREENNRIVPAKKGERGLLIYTTIAREGTIYIRYAPGDEATVVRDESECECGLKSKVISDIRRVDNPNDVVSMGCCIG